MERRRMMMDKRKYRIEYSLAASTYSYIQKNGEGEKLSGTGETEIKKGEFLLCYAYANSGSYIEKDGKTVAENSLGAATFEFYPESDAKITVKTGADVTGTHLVITTG